MGCRSRTLLQTLQICLREVPDVPAACSGLLLVLKPGKDRSCRPAGGSPPPTNMIQKLIWKDRCRGRTMALLKMFIHELYLAAPGHSCGMQDPLLVLEPGIELRLPGLGLWTHRKVSEPQRFTRRMSRTETLYQVLHHQTCPAVGVQTGMS